MREFMERVVLHHVVMDDSSFDENYLKAGESYPRLPGTYRDIADYIQGFKAVAAPDTSFFRKVHDHNANVAWVRIMDIPDRKDVVVSMVIDRWHDNVKYISGEDQRLDPTRDQADFISGFVGAYPNYFFQVSLADLPDFLTILTTYEGRSDACRLEKYGVNRAEPRFRQVYDWFQEAFFDTNPLEAGIIDLNRYYFLAIGQDMAAGTDEYCKNLETDQP